MSQDSMITNCSLRWGAANRLAPQNTTSLPLQRQVSALAQRALNVPTPAFFQTRSFAALRCGRRRTEFNDNVTCSWQYERVVRQDSRQEERSLRERMIHHAYVRVQILFYIFAAYYQEGVQVERVATRTQHGRQTVGGMSAAHSSILPNLSDNFFEKLQQTLSEVGLNFELQQKLRSLGISENKITEWSESDGSDEEIEKLLADIPEDDRKRMFSGHSALYKAMNSTVEVPLVVNQFDSLIETRHQMRERAVELVNQVSAGEIDPLQATQIFVCEMQNFFQACEKEILEKITRLRFLNTLQNRIMELEGQIRNDQFGDPIEWTRKYQSCFRQIQDHLTAITQRNQFSPKTFVPKLFPKHDQIARIISAEKTFKNEAKFFERLQEEIIKIWRYTPISVTQLIQTLENNLKIVEFQSVGTCVPEISFLFPDSSTSVQNTLFSLKLEIIRRNSSG